MIISHHLLSWSLRSGSPTLVSMSARDASAPSSASESADLSEASADEYPAHAASSFSVDDANSPHVPTIVLKVMCMAGSLPPLENVPFNLRVTDLKRRIHEARADLPAHTQRLVVMTQSADGESSSHVVLGDNETLDSFACVTDGCTIQVVMAQGRVTFEAAVYLAAVLEYLSAEILELSGNAARVRGKSNIAIRDIRAAISNDEELNHMIGCLAMYHKRALPFMFPEFDAEYADNLVEDAESVDRYKYADWGVDEDERENSTDDEDGDDEPPIDELIRDEETDGDESKSRLSGDDAVVFLNTHVKPLFLRRGVVTNLQYSYQDYVFKVLKQVHPQIGITKQGMETVNLILNLALNVIASFAFYRAAECCEKTLVPLAIQNAVQVVLSGELTRHAVSEGTKGVTKLNSPPSMRRPNETFSQRAGLQFPLFHQYLNAEFATSFIPEPVAQPSLAGNSFPIAILPTLHNRSGHSFCLEVTGDDCVGDVMSRAHGVFLFSPSQEYALVYVDEVVDNANETLLDASHTLNSYGIDARCWDTFASPSNDDKPRPSLLLRCVDELSLKVGCTTFMLQFHLSVTYL